MDLHKLYTSASLRVGKGNRKKYVFLMDKPLRGGGGKGLATEKKNNFF